MKTKSNLDLLNKIARESGGKVVIASVTSSATSTSSNWGHHISMMPCAETLESAKSAIESLSLNRTNIFGVCIHHTDTTTADKARSTLKKKNFSTHCIIDKNGDITVELPFDKRAAACVGFNKWMLQIDVVGRFQLEKPTNEQLISLENLIRLLACGRPIKSIDANFAKKCIKLSTEDVQKATVDYYKNTYDKYHERADKRGGWKGVLDKLPFTVIYHGEVRPTACCGKNLIKELPKIIKSLQGNQTKG